nr:MAG TPA: putative internal virion protein B [Caudoviricetes sp.]
MSGVVIGAGAIIGGIIGGGSSLNSISKQNKQKTKAFLKQMHYLQMNYNYNQAALDRQERSRYDSALADLFTMSLNSYQNNSQIEAALAETGTEGRSSGKIMQTISGQTERQKTAYKESYLNDVWNIRGQKEALYISTKTEVEQARDQLSASYIHGSQAFGQFVNGVAMGAALGAATAGAGSAIGGAVSGSVGGKIGGEVGGTLAANAGVDAISSASPMVTTAGGASATNVVANAGVASTIASNASTGTAATNVASSAGSKMGFMDRVIANWDSYDKYFKFYNQIANYGNMVQQATQRRRGYYY